MFEKVAHNLSSPDTELKHKNKKKKKPHATNKNDLPGSSH